MSDNARRYRIFPDGAAILKATVPDCVWQNTGDREHAELTIQGVSLKLSYFPPILDVVVVKKPWYVTMSLVWEKLDEYIYQNTREKGE